MKHSSSSIIISIISVISVISVLVGSNPARADEIAREHLATITDPTSVQTTVDCLRWATGNYPPPFRGRWRACREWRARSTVLENRYDFVVSTPDDITDEVRRVVTEGLVVAGVAAAATPGEASVKFAAARAAFVEYVRVRLPSRVIDVRLDTTGRRRPL